MGSITINSNISSLISQRHLKNSSTALHKSFQRLSSGLRINSATDDAAGLAIAESLKTDKRIFSQAIRNGNDGVSLLSIAEGALDELSKITIRQIELAEQASNGVYSLDQREALHQEAQALVEEYNRIVQSTEFNNISLLTDPTQTTRLQIGYGELESLNLELGSKFANTASNDTFTSVIGANITQANQALTGDLNNDGFQDIVGAGGGGVTITMGNGDGTFNTPSLVAGASARVAIGDADNDGILDIIKSHSFGIELMIGNGDGTFKADSLVTNQATFFPEVGDINGDGNLDVIGADNTNNALVVALGNGDGTFHASSSYFVPNGPQDVRLADLNGDSKLDALTLDRTNRELIIFSNIGNGTFGSAVTYQIGGAGNAFSLDVGDFNGDGIEDVVTGTSSVGQDLFLLIGNGDSSFKASNNFYSGVVANSIRMTDYNEDGINDIMVGSFAAQSATLFKNDGSGTFAVVKSFAATGNVRSITSADINNDSASDIIFSDSSGFARIALGDPELNVLSRRLELRSAHYAKESLTHLKETLNRLTSERGNIGALQSRVDSALRNLHVKKENYASAESLIMDADIAAESAGLVRKKILQQASTSVLAKANLQPSIALSLLE